MELSAFTKDIINPRHREKERNMPASPFFLPSVSLQGFSLARTSQEPADREPGRAAIITVPRTGQEKGGSRLRCSPGTDSKVKVLKLLLGNGEVSLFQTFLTKQHIQKEQGKEHYEQVWEAVTYRFEIPGWDGWMMQGWGRGAGCSIRCYLSFCQLHRGTAPREAHGPGHLLVQEHSPSQVHSACPRGDWPHSHENG